MNYLMEENIDSSTKFERYHLFNHIYSKIYDYKKVMMAEYYRKYIRNSPETLSASKISKIDYKKLSW